MSGDDVPVPESIRHLEEGSLVLKDRELERSLLESGENPFVMAKKLVEEFLSGHPDITEVVGHFKRQAEADGMSETEVQAYIDGALKMAILLYSEES